MLEAPILLPYPIPTSIYGSPTRHFKFLASVRSFQFGHPVGEQFRNRRKNRHRYPVPTVGRLDLLRSFAVTSTFPVPASSFRAHSVDLEPSPSALPKLLVPHRHLAAARQLQSKPLSVLPRFHHHPLAQILRRAVFHPDVSGSCTRRSYSTSINDLCIGSLVALTFTTPQHVPSDALPSSHSCRMLAGFDPPQRRGFLLKPSVEGKHAASHPFSTIKAEKGPLVLTTNMEEHHSFSANSTAVSEEAAAVYEVGDTPKPTYTTVGSIYNPSTSTQLQPPTRRGRQLRWPNPAQTDSSLTPRSLFTGLPLHHTLPQSPPATSATFQQYSPLQQNYDRAVSPPIDLERSVRAKLDMSPEMAFVDPPCWASSAGSDKVDQANTVDEEDDEYATDDMEALAATQFNVKALTNLSSYPNPMQKTAQKLLARGRPALSAATNVHRLPFSSGLLDYPSSGFGADQVATASRLQQPVHNTATTPDRLLKPDTDSGRARWVTSLARPGLPGRQEPVISLRHRAGGVKMGVGRFPSLAKGPGAPAPLTAGPPGQRQYRASTFEATIKALQESAEKSGLGQESEIAIKYRPLPIGHGRPVRPIATQPALSTDSSLSTDSRPLTPLLEGSFADNSVLHQAAPIRETQVFEAVRHYYPTGIPKDWGRLKGAGEIDWFDVRRAQEETHYRKTPEVIAERNSQLNAAFYAGRNELSKPIDVVIREAEHRHFEKRMGISDDQQRRCIRASLGADPVSRGEYPYLPINEANDLPTAAHAEPLLTMTFATLLNIVEAQQGPTRSRPTNFGNLGSFLVDSDGNS